MTEKMAVVAKEVYDNLPFANSNFRPESVNDTAKRLEILIKKKWISDAWINSVYKASRAGQAIFINLDKDWNWTFLTSKTGTRDDIVNTIRGQ